MEAPQSLYSQSATHFVLPIYLRSETDVEPGLVGDLADLFLSRLLLPGTRLAALHTRRPGDGARLNMGAFSDARWTAAQKKLARGEYSVLEIEGHTPDFPMQKIACSIQVNPVGCREFRVAGTIAIRCSVSYLRHLAHTPDRVDALLAFARTAWNGIAGGPAYGYGHLAMTLARPAFDPRLPRPTGAPMPWDYIQPPADRPHAVPIAYVGHDIEGNLSSLYCGNRGIKGAFWCNLLSAAHVAMAGGMDRLAARLQGLHVEPLDHGGLLVVATDSPLPDDTDDTRSRFRRLDDALQPMFLSREETAPIKRGMLGCFYRERPPLE